MGRILEGGTAFVKVGRLAFEPVREIGEELSDGFHMPPIWGRTDSSSTIILQQSAKSLPIRGEKFGS
jgi:hypothetical protein